MKKRMIALSVTCGMLCALCVVGYTMLVQRNAEAARNEAVEKYGGEQIEVLVATRDIFPGEGVDSSNSERTLWVASLLPADAATSLEQVSGKQVSSTILKGEVVSEKRFDAEAVRIDIPEGMVAVSVPAKEVQALGGALEAGSLVDVYATGSTTTCLGQQVLVLATSASSSENSQNAKISWVTLAVVPEQAQEYVSASQQTELYFTLPAAKQQQSEQQNGQPEVKGETQPVEGKETTDAANANDATSANNASEHADANQQQ